MNAGKTLFAQVMEFVLWKTFGWIIERHRGDVGVRTLGCADLFSDHGLRSADVARISSRYRILSDGQTDEAVPHGAEDSSGSLERWRMR
jgi:hypothetical protein